MNQYCQCQYNTFGQLHRDGGLPAREWINGTKEWYKDGQKHRDDGLPAVEYANGTKEWYVHGKLHRENGLPAVEWADGGRAWWVNGKLHREGGLPAVELGNHKDWWLNGRKLLAEEVIAYMEFCQKMVEKKRIRAQKKIYFWWIQICYDLEHKSGCGQRMAQKNLEMFESMMKT